MAGYVLLRKSQSAWDERNGLRMLTLAQAVQSGPWPLPAHVRAEAAQQEARGHAMTTGDTTMINRKLDEARDLLAEASSAREDRSLAERYNHALLMVQTAMCYRYAGRQEEAVSLYEDALMPEAFSRRDYGYFLALKAETMAAVHDPDGASQTAMQSLHLARATGSIRTLHELQRAHHGLVRWSDRESVRDFQAALVIR